MPLIQPFERISKHDAATAGGKGASLGEMTQAGIPVPPGYVILADAFEQFISETKLKSEIDSILHRVKKEEMESVERASEEIQALILSAKMPKDIASEIKKHFKELNAEFVAVRSSATAEDSSAAAWAGQLDTFLNTTEKTLLQNVQKCWASLFTPRAIFYRFEKGLHNTHISVAVVVQKMVQSEISGIAFSVHPVTQDYNQMIIEGGFGLGEAIVSGQITPDSYVLEKKPFTIIEKNVSEQSRGIFRKKEGGSGWKDIPSAEGSKQKLSEKQIMELGKLILRIETHYGFPVDVEWAFEKGKFYITQSRPITTLMKKNVASMPSTLPDEKVEMGKYYTREYSLFCISVWCESNTTLIRKWLGRNTKHALFINEGNGKKFSAWFSNKEEFWNTEPIKRIQEDRSYFPCLKKTFWEHWGFMSERFRHKIESFAELKEYYYHYRQWWAPMAILMYLPDLPSVPSAIKKECERIREKTQEYSALDEQVFAPFILARFPEYEELIPVLLPDELFALEQRAFSASELKKIRERLKGFVYYNNRVYPLGDLQNILEKNNLKLMPLLVPHSNELRGQTAFPGRVNGKVRIILEKDQLHMMEKGEIFVTEMTSPSYVQAMKRASAIVTDEGGITSHAAIACREMKIPCIIGTKNATQVLHDGDLIEVDADKGIVRIVKRAHA
ncbi:MAG: hypothetical protein IPJ89_01335 [Candidatus Iainarchaeum archaeon]|uniref:pyruvate, water dikinase n=1 Tax=Candidatus Iainarchaeum sp. TaxID=3101447 RepID=A0A7T9I1X9_9ARCH|nr:MAG: hypothetical protein IPJ89_01335 [Candidatus Diapherotrites archaeon]